MNASMAYSDILSRNLFGGAEENHEQPTGLLFFGSTFEHQYGRGYATHKCEDRFSVTGLHSHKVPVADTY